MKVWALDIAALDAVGDHVTLRFASGDYTQEEAGPVHYFYEPRLIQPSLFTVSANTGVLLPGLGDSSIGEAELINADGELDYLADYATDGRAMSLRLIEDGVATQATSGTVQKLSFNGNKVVVTLRDPLAELDNFIPSNLYAGDNSLPAGVEGTADDIGGTRKPLVFGSVSNASPVLVNTSKLIYQVHDGADVTVTAVRDRGVVLTYQEDATDLADLLATTPDAGKWRRYQGYFALGSQGQAITCDAERDDTGAGTVFEQLATIMGFNVLAADVTVLDAVGDVGLFVLDDRPAYDAMAEIAQGCGAYWGHNGTDIRVIPLAAPGSVDLTIEDYQILRLDRTATGSGANGLPVPTVTVQADRVETTQTDLADTAANQARYVTEYRDATSADAAVAARHPLSEKLVIQSPLRSLADASAVASDLLSVLKVRRDIVECRAAIDDFSDLVLGNTVQLNTSRLGYPRSFVLLGWNINARRNRTTLKLWG